MKATCGDVISKSSEVNGIISCAVDLANVFVQLNWTGSPDDLDIHLESLVGGGDISHLNRESVHHLSWDGEVFIAVAMSYRTDFVINLLPVQPVYPLVRHPVLLYTAHLLLDQCSSYLHDRSSPLLLKLHRWRLRCLNLQQKLLSQRSASLCEEMNRVMDNLKSIMTTSILTE